MEVILEGVIRSEHPFAVKKHIALQIANAACNNTDVNIIRNLLTICGKLYIKAECIDEKTIINIVATKWVQNHKTTFELFLITDYLQKSFPSINGNIEVIKILKYFVDVYKSIHHSLTQDLSIQLQQYLIMSISFVTDMEALVMFAELFLECPLPLTDDDNLLETVKVILNVVSKTTYVFSPLPVSPHLVKTHSNTKQIQVVCKLFSQVVTKNTKLIRSSSRYLFKLLSDQSNHPSIALAVFLPYLQLEMLVNDIEEFLMSNVTNDLLMLILGHIIDWICFPDQNLHVDEWILLYMRSLIKYRKFEALFTVIENKANQVCNMLFFPLMRNAAVQVLTFMLMSYLHSPAPFHQVAVNFPNILEYLKKTETEEAKQACHVLVQLIYTLMYNFPGYPDVYAPLLLSMQHYPKPSVVEMKKWLEASHSLPRVQLTRHYINMKKSDTGKIGLENLGNTCYINSVVQAFFNLSSVKHSVLSKTYSDISQPVSSSLQLLFAFLLSSKRPTIAPQAFCKLSRPLWFAEGSQQDCSEYLKFLLDVIQQEGCCEDEVVNKLCTGKIRATIECLQCHSISSRSEPFNDIPLSFYSISTDQASPTGQCTLKGGNSSEQMERKRHVHDVSSTEDMNIDAVTENINDGNEASVNVTEEHNYSIVSMLNSHFTPEDLNDLNKYHCQNCSSLQNARQYTNITKYPKYLILTLKRFTYNVHTQKRSKILKTVEYQLNINACRGCDACNEERRSNRTRVLDKPSGSNTHHHEPVMFTSTTACDSVERYRPVSIIVHSGLSSDNGHYYCYTCTYSADGEPSWFLLNDSRVSRSPDGFLTVLGKTFPRDTPYVCIYEKLSEETSLLNEIVLSDEMRQIIALDNQKYVQELHDEAVKREKTFVFPRGNQDDDDSFGNGGQGSCGGSQNEQDFAGGRYVF